MFEKQNFVLMMLLIGSHATLIPDDLQLAADPTGLLPASCLTLRQPATMTVQQNLAFGTTRTITFSLTSDVVPALGHELCISQGQMSRSSGGAGTSQVTVHYEFAPGNLEREVILTHEADRNRTLAFRLNDEPEQLLTVEEEFPWTALTAAQPLSSLAVIFQAIPGVDMRVSFVERPSIYSYRTTIPIVRRVVDDDESTFISLKNGDSFNVIFPDKLETSNMTLVWKRKAQSVTIKYGQQLVASSLVTKKKTFLSWPSQELFSLEIFVYGKGTMQLAEIY